MEQYEYINTVLPLGASEEKMNERVAEYEAKGYTLCGTYALDTGNIVIRFKRPKYGQGRVT